MRRAWSAAAVVVLALALVGCGDGGDSDGDDANEPEESGLASDADALVSCLGDADVEATVDDNEAFGVQTEHVGVKATDLPSETLKFDTGSGTLNSVALWVFESAGDAEGARVAITLSGADDEKGWVDGRVVVSWDYPVNREAAQAVAVDDCVADLNA